VPRGAFFFTPLTRVVTSGINENDAGAASGLMNTAKQVGGALGLAALIAVAGHRSHTTQTLATGYGHAFLAMAAILAAIAALALALPAQRDTTTRPATGDRGLGLVPTPIPRDR
jgi:sugar phosphate permease